MSFDSLLSQSCNIQRYNLRQNDVGGAKRVWSNVFTGVPCRVEQLSSIEQTIMSREGVQGTHRGFVQSTTTATVKDRLVTGGETYEIEGVDESRGATEVHHYELTLVLRK
jgi:head-tail adaptor